MFHIKTDIRQYKCETKEKVEKLIRNWVIRPTDLIYLVEQEHWAPIGEHPTFTPLFVLLEEKEMADTEVTRNPLLNGANEESEDETYQLQSSELEAVPPEDAARLRAEGKSSESFEDTEVEELNAPAMALPQPPEGVEEPVRDDEDTKVFERLENPAESESESEEVDADEAHDVVDDAPAGKVNIVRPKLNAPIGRHALPEELFVTNELVRGEGHDEDDDSPLDELGEVSENLQEDQEAPDESLEVTQKRPNPIAAKVAESEPSEEGEATPPDSDAVTEDRGGSNPESGSEPQEDASSLNISQGPSSEHADSEDGADSGPLEPGHVFEADVEIDQREVQHVRSRQDQVTDKIVVDRNRLKRTTPQTEEPVAPPFDDLESRETPTIAKTPPAGIQAVEAKAVEPRSPANVTAANSATAETPVLDNVVINDPFPDPKKPAENVQRPHRALHEHDTEEVPEIEVKMVPFQDPNFVSEGYRIPLPIDIQLSEEDLEQGLKVSAESEAIKERVFPTPKPKKNRGELIQRSFTFGHRAPTSPAGIPAWVYVVGLIAIALGLLIVLFVAVSQT